MSAFHGGQRQTDIILAVSHGCHSSFDGDRVDFAEECFDQRHQLALQVRTAFDITIKESGADINRFLRHYIGKYGNHACAAHGKDRGDLIIIAGPDIQTALNDSCGFHDFSDVSVGFFDAGDVRVIREHIVSGWFDIDTGAGRNIIKDQRFVNCIGNGSVHFNQSPLRGFVIIWCHTKQGIVSQFTGFL